MRAARYTDGDENNRQRTWEEAHKIEAVEKAQALIPPSIKHRASAYWNVINHRHSNADQLKSALVAISIWNGFAFTWFKRINLCYTIYEILAC